MFVNLSDNQLKEIQDLKFIGGWEDENDVYLWHRIHGQRNVIHIPGVSRYFCISRTDFENNKINWNSYKSRGLYDRGLLSGRYAYIYSDKKLYQSTWKEWLTELDDKGLKPLEGDISRLQRLMIDYQLQVAGPTDDNGPRVAFFDIETDDSGDRIRIGEDKIVSVAWKDQQTGAEYFLALPYWSEEAEKEFLKKVYTELVQYDVLIGYNNYGFDDEYLLGRFEKYEFDLTKWKRVATLDMFNTFERQGTYRNYDVRNKKLDTIAKAVLGRGKVPHTEKIYELWASKPELLKEYNLEDVRLLYDMERILGSAGLVMSVCSFAGLLHSQKYSPAKTVDSFLLRSSFKRRKAGGYDFRFGTGYYRPEHNVGGKFGGAFSKNALPSDKRKGRAELLLEQFDIEYEPVQGAYVMEAEPGLYTNVYAFDFQSLYPNTIRAFNIGHDTLVDKSFTGPKNQAPNGVWYRTDFISGMSEGVSFLIDKRREVRAQAKLEKDEVRIKALDILQRGIKELTNSFYGVTAQYGGRYYSKQIAESITSGGRTFLPFGDEFLSSRGHKAVIGDTDSLYVSVNGDKNPEELIKEYTESLYEMLRLKYNVYKPDYLKMSYEKRMESVLIIAKKLYSGWVVMEDGKPVNGHLVNKGLMLLKGNYPKWATNICLEILQDLLEKGIRDSDHYKRLLQREKDRIATGNIDYHELMVNARIGKDLDKYENENALCHVRIARRLAASGKHVPFGTTISYLVTDGEKVLHSVRKTIDGVSDEEITPETKYDAVHYWNDVLIKQVEALLSPVFDDIDWDSIRFPRYLKRTNYFEMKVKINDKS